jgi:alpha-ketoglutaric semialdehyde dehydrogenase
MSAETKNFIAGKWVATGSTFDSVNPATGELVSRCAEASQQELDAAVAAACEAFPAWRKTPPPRRAAILFRVAELLTARKDDLARWITCEMGKVTMEARGDVQEAIDMARYMAGEGRRMFGHTAPSELPDKFCMSLRDPIGVAAVITPWNFPIAVPSWKILPALVLGNTVVWKPSSDTPVCAAKFVEAFVEAGLPPGVLNLVLGKGAEIGDALVRHRDVRLVTFTGSNAFPKATAAADVSILQQCLTMSHPQCASRARKSSAPWCPSSKPVASKKPSPSTNMWDARPRKGVEFGRNQNYPGVETSRPQV